MLSDVFAGGAVATHWFGEVVKLLQQSREALRGLRAECDGLRVVRACTRAGGRAGGRARALVVVCGSGFYGGFYGGTLHGAGVCVRALRACVRVRGERVYTPCGVGVFHNSITAVCVLLRVRACCVNLFPVGVSW